MNEYKTMATAERFLQLAEEVETASKDEKLTDIQRHLKMGMEIAYRDAALRVQWATEELPLPTAEIKEGVA